MQLCLLIVHFQFQGRFRPCNAVMNSEWKQVGGSWVMGYPWVSSILDWDLPLQPSFWVPPFTEAPSCHFGSLGATRQVKPPSLGYFQTKSCGSWPNWPRMQEARGAEAGRITDQNYSCFFSQEVGNQKIQEENQKCLGNSIERSPPILMKTIV